MLSNQLVASTAEWVKSFFPESLTRNVVYSGSIVQGWNHAESDIDVYVIADSFTVGANWPVRFTESYFELSEPDVPVAVNWVNGTKVDCELWTHDQIDELSRILRPKDPKNNWELTIDESYFDTFYRLSIARSLEPGSPCAKIFDDQAQQTVANNMARRRLDEADAYMEDTVGLLESKDFPQSAYLAHISYRKVIDALVSSRGEYQPNGKWRPRRVKKVAPELFREYWEVETFRNINDNYESWTTDVLRKSKSIASRLEVA